MTMSDTHDLSQMMSRLAVLQKLGNIPEFEDDCDSSESFNESNTASPHINHIAFENTRKQLLDSSYGDDILNREENNEHIKSLEIENKRLRDELNLLKRRKVPKENAHVPELRSIKSELGNLKINYKKLEQEKEKLSTELSTLKQTTNKLELIEINKKSYQIVGKIGAGGFSEVYKCLCVDKKEIVAVKKVLANDKESAQLMKNEIDLLIKLKNSNRVVHLLDHQFISEQSLFHLVMELGSTDLQAFFKREIQTNGCIKEPDRVYFWIKMLEAVKAIHEHGIIHSDLKPSNFLLVGHEVKLIDFNISNDLDDRTSMTVKNDCGTLYFMAPESLTPDGQQRGKISFKTDVWSLGCILYMMTYGRLPLHHIKNQLQLFYALSNSDKHIKFATISNCHLMHVLKNTLKHNQKERLSIDELLKHDYVQSKM